jgi:hypothetical protein
LRHHFLAVAVTIGLAGAVFAPRAEERSLDELYKGHRWFELRDAIVRKRVPALYTGAVASAFNRTAEAEKHLRQAVREASTAESANDAREALINLYMRVGRSSDMLRTLDDAVTAAPSRADFRNVREVFASFRGLRDQTATVGRRQSFRCTVAADGVLLPLSINGKGVAWLFDSAFSHAALTESEARLVGVRVLAGKGQAGDFAGGSTATRVGVAERVSIGGAELRNVPLLVFADSQPPWNDKPPGQRGTVGLPVALALGALGWTRGGTCSAGLPTSRAARGGGNLAFDGVAPVIRTQFNAVPLDFVLDTGNQRGTQLWERFARDFPALLSKGRKATTQLNQIGGSAEHPIVVLPEIQLRVGALHARLRPANVFSRPIGNVFHHGNLGFDVLSQAEEVIIDFQTMALIVR